MVNETNCKIAELRGGAVDIGKVHTLRTDIDPTQYPDYEHDLNIAMPLFIDLPEPSAIEIDRVINSWHVVFDVEAQYHNIYGESNDLSSQALAQAICESWLQWKGVK